MSDLTEAVLDSGSIAARCRPGNSGVSGLDAVNSHYVYPAVAYADGYESDALREAEIFQCWDVGGNISEEEWKLQMSGLLDRLMVMVQDDVDDTAVRPYSTVLTEGGQSEWTVAIYVGPVSRGAKLLNYPIVFTDSTRSPKHLSLIHISEPTRPY